MTEVLEIKYVAAKCEKCAARLTALLTEPINPTEMGWQLLSVGMGQYRWRCPKHLVNQGEKS